MRGSVRAPYGDSSRTSSARLNSAFAVSRWPSCSSFWPAWKWRFDSLIRSTTGSAGAAGAFGCAAATWATVATGDAATGRATVVGAWAAQAADVSARAQIAPRRYGIVRYSTIRYFEGST